jgi:tRNA threonylcarbamoyladenosine biosynthesis protein TsaB
MRILAIDTSGEACSAALLTETGIAQRLVLEPRRHADLILGLVEALLREADTQLTELDALAFGRGPGSFTGVRIATAVVQGLAFGADLPVLAVSSLAGLAQGQHRRQGARQCLAALDARMGEIYWGRYVMDSQGLMRLVGEEAVTTPALAELPEDDGWQGAGSGWDPYGDLLRQRLGLRIRDVDPAAICESQDLVLMAAADFAAGLALPPEQALPVYLRDKVTQGSR